MPWPVALGLFFAASVAQALLQRSYSQRSKLPESFPPALSYLLGVTPLGLIVGLNLAHHIQWSTWVVTLLLLEGLFIGLYNQLAFMAIKRLPLARFQTVYQLYELVVVALGWMVLKEQLSGLQVVGGVLILLAAFLAIRAPVKAEAQLSAKKVNSAAIALTVAAAVVMGIGLVIEKAALHYMDIGAYFIFGYGTQTLAISLLAGKALKRTNLRAIKQYDIQRSLSMGLLSALVGFFYIAAIVNADNISLITALAAFGLPLTVAGGYIFLKERDDLKLLIGSVVIGLGGLLISAIH